MSIKTVRLDEVLVTLGDKADKPIWIQVAKPGVFRGHHAAKVFEMNATVFSQIIANFNAQGNKFIPVDFEHASEQSPTEGTIPTHGAPAQGWITQLEMRTDGNLWGLVEWGKLAQSYIRNGQYKYLSPAIVFGAKDRVTGKPCGARLSSVALTNNPFLDAMQPVAAKHNGQPHLTDEGVVEVIREAMSLPTYADAPFILASLNVIEQSAGQVGGADKKLVTSKIRDALRLPLTMTVQDVFKTVRVACGDAQETILPPAGPLPVLPIETKPAQPTQEMTNMTVENKEKDTEISSLTLKLSAAEKDKTTLMSDHAIAMKAVVDENAELKVKLAAYEEREITTLVDNAVSIWGEKKGLTAESRPHLMRLAKNDREAFTALYPQKMPGSPAQPHHGKLVAAGAHNVPAHTLPMGQGAEVINLKTVMKDVPSVTDIAQKLIHDAKQNGIKMTREEAFGRAHSELIRLTAAAKKSLAGNGG